MFTKNYIGEEWKPVKGFEGLYEVSNMGRVKSLERWVRSGNGMGLHFHPERILKQVMVGNYLGVSLCKGSRSSQKIFKTHRLVAEAFIANPNNYPQVNHINEIKTDNWVELDDDGNILDSNLEWCTPLYNVNYGSHNQKLSISKKGVLINRPDMSKPVCQFTKDGQFIAEYSSQSEAARQIGIYASGVSQCCLRRKKHKSAEGYIWRYREDCDLSSLFPKLIA